MLMGSIMRTFMVLSFGLLPLGNFAGSKSGGKYLFSTFRSPMLTSFVQLHQEVKVCLTSLSVFCRQDMQAHQAEVQSVAPL